MNPNNWREPWRSIALGWLMIFGAVVVVGYFLLFDWPPGWVVVACVLSTLAWFAPLCIKPKETNRG